MSLFLIVVFFTYQAFGQTTEAGLMDKGMALYSEGKYNESLQTYDKVLEIDPHNEVSWNDKGIDLSMLDRYDEALEAFHNATAMNSSYAEAWYNMGVIFDLKGDPLSAVQAYKIATEINPSYQKALILENRDSDILMAPSLSCSCSNQLPLL